MVINTRRPLSPAERSFFQPVSRTWAANFLAPSPRFSIRSVKNQSRPARRQRPVMTTARIQKNLYFTRRMLL